MKACIVFALLFAFVLTYCPAFSQSQKGKQLLPSYDQIRQKDREIDDYINKDGTAQITQKDSVNLFNYPSGTVTYLLNGKPSSDIQYVKRVLSRKGRIIESLSIHRPNQHGKRLIEIKYE
ncbi:hypothetical protein LX87_01234 [Larkinella arboricola]|uniref:Uncharacterized protein n=1 Tax=Larkinella arboricola TaxID=643671 RepID=A0A327XBU6_LARAB|nr:hypothetical protein [Larkinella arboricola]RAK03112.1 hypothetical protein LX87_01234 [Larkinella arboricola]